MSLSLLDEMRVAKISPDVYCLDTVIHACKEAGRWEAAGAVEKGREAVEREGQWPNQLSFNAALSTATRKVDASLKK